MCIFWEKLLNRRSVGGSAPEPSLATGGYTPRLPRCDSHLLLQHFVECVSNAEHDLLDCYPRTSVTTANLDSRDRYAEAVDDWTSTRC